MNIANLLKALTDILEERIGAVVSLGPPSEASSGIFIWPWKITESTVHRNAPPSTASAEIELSQEAVPVDLHFLIVAHPAFTLEGLSLLEAVNLHISSAPLVATKTGDSLLAIETLPDQTLASLFQSAGLPVSACVCVKTTIFRKHTGVAGESADL